MLCEYFNKRFQNTVSAMGPGGIKKVQIALLLGATENVIKMAWFVFGVCNYSVCYKVTFKLFHF